MRLPSKSLLFLLLLASGASAQTTRNVPAEFAKIQEAINASAAGDTVLVAPGTYVENLNFKGKNITVRSSAGAAMTIIDGNKAGSVVTFTAKEGNAAILSGFTLRNGRSSDEGGGVFISEASPTLQDNVITDNLACDGLGIAISFGSPLIQRNVISNNRHSGCAGIGGGGILLRGAGSARILNNVITGNTTLSRGGGLSLWAAGTPTIRDNIISNNTAARGGGGLELVNASNAVIVGNQITGNSAPTGGGISWLVPSGAPGPVVVNNTIADNDSANGSGIFADGYDGAARVVNNIIVASKSGQVALFCGNFNDTKIPILQNNDVFGANGAVAYGGICADQTGTNGNISADPRFFLCTASGHYLLAAGSPALDVGDNAAPHLLATDLEGFARVWDADCDGASAVDLGALEFPGATLKLTPTSLDFGEQVVGTVSGSRGVTLQNASCAGLTVSPPGVTGDFASGTACGSPLAPGDTCEVPMSFQPRVIGLRVGLLEVGSSASCTPVHVVLSGMGTEVPDTVEPDAGGWEPDAGVGEPDAGGWEPDAGGWEPDAGVGGADAGSGPVQDPTTGCGCQSGLPGSGAMLTGWLLLALACFARPRFRSAR
jgi:parallel beta-helix repeat protein